MYNGNPHNTPGYIYIADKLHHAIIFPVPGSRSNRGPPGGDQRHPPRDKLTHSMSREAVIAPNRQ